MAKLVEYITPTWIPEEGNECIPIYDPFIDGERIELVRCKDCTYRGEINCPQYYRRTELSDDYFCADGKRR